MNSPNRRAVVFLKAVQVLSYLGFVFVWFKDNFPPLWNFHLSPAIPLAVLILVTAVRSYLRFRSSPRTFRLSVRKDWAVVVLIILLATAVRIPYFAHNYGLMDGDEAIPALQGKHIAEGKVPAIYYYGALFQGSLPQQYYAAFCWVFGYSALVIKVAAYLAFVGFIILQYILLKAIFSRSLAFAACFFYVFPFNNLILASFDVGSGMAIVLFLGVLIFYWTYLIFERGRDDLLGPLGFLIGLAFWTHQISIIFILTSAVFLFFRYKLRVKKYLVLALYALMGVFPILMSEVYYKFPLVRMLSSGGSQGVVSGSKIARLKRLTLALFSSGPSFLDWVYLALLILGFCLLVANSLRKRRVLPSALFSVFALAYAAVYILSTSSDVEVIRYLLILYIAIPVFFAAAFFALKSNPVRWGAAVAFFAALFFVSGWKTSVQLVRTVTTMDTELRRVLDGMGRSGEKYWKANYWISYLINSVGAERFIVSSTTVERYPYYQLAYDSESPHMNYVILRDSAEEEKKAADITGLLTRTRKTFETQTIARWTLIYGIRGYVYSKNLLFPPDGVPDIAFKGVAASDDGLTFRFAPVNREPGGGYRMHVEIEGWSERFVPVPVGDAFTVTMPYPVPRRDRARVRFYLDFQGLLLDSTISEKDVELPAAPATLKRNTIEYLSGFGPREKATAKGWLACGKDIRFEVNSPPSGASKITLVLYSPFNFGDPFWYGRYVQEARVYVNRMPLARFALKEGHNTLGIPCGGLPFGDGSNIVEIKFTYEWVVSVRDHWKTAAYLEDLRID